MRIPNGKQYLFGFIASMIGAGLAVTVGLPLPWLLGPLFVVASLRLTNQSIKCPPLVKHVGQFVIGISLGLFFTPDITELIIKHYLAIVLGIVFAMCLGLLGTLIFIKIGQTDPKTAWFAAAIGGASEMTTLADRFGARADLVATSHSIRLFAVVTIIPFAYAFWGVKGIDLQLPLSHLVQLQDLLMLTMLAGIGGVLFQRFQIPNPWVLGPLFITIGLIATQTLETGLPFGLSQAGQLMIGWSLGDRYRSQFLKAAPRFTLAVLTYTASALILTSVVAMCVSYFSSLPMATLLLSFAPGGLAEMSITAKVLMLGAPIVTAFQVSRMVCVVVLTTLLQKRFLLKAPESQ